MRSGPTGPVADRNAAIRSDAPGVPGCSTAPNPSPRASATRTGSTSKRQHPRTHRIGDERGRRTDEPLSDDDHGLRRPISAEMQGRHGPRTQVRDRRFPQPDARRQPVNGGSRCDRERLVAGREHDRVAGRTVDTPSPRPATTPRPHVQQLLAHLRRLEPAYDPARQTCTFEPGVIAVWAIRTSTSPGPGDGTGSSIRVAVRGAVRYQWSKQSATLSTRARGRPR